MNVDLQGLQTVTCDILARAESEWEGTGAINWADLSCVEAECAVNQDCIVTLRVWIEEASPDNAEFCKWVQDQLAEAGYPGVDVRTEW